MHSTIMQMLLLLIVSEVFMATAFMQIHAWDLMDWLMR